MRNIKVSKNRVYRIIDANLNRSREALRVCEDITRFMLDDASLSTRFKRLRYRISLNLKRLPCGYMSLLESRNSKGDVGREPTRGGIRRRDFEDIFSANIERAKESLRSLEEFTKPVKKTVSEEFQKIRFACYELEKGTIKRFRAICRLGQNCPR